GRCWSWRSCATGAAWPPTSRCSTPSAPCSVPRSTRRRRSRPTSSRSSSSTRPWAEGGPARPTRAAAPPARPRLHPRRPSGDIVGASSETPPSTLRADLVGGIALAAFAIPESMAYAGLAGLPPQAGLYGYLVAGPLFALFTSARHVAIGPTSALSLMVAAALAPLA